MSFQSTGLTSPILRALTEEGYTEPTLIQTQAIPPAMAGRDVLGCAQTGTGKTAAFALPILHRLSFDPRRAPARRPRALILAPTRELAAQIGESFEAYGRHLPFRTAVVYGGVGYRDQLAALASGVEILVATPGRLLDLMERRAVQLGSVEIAVLDEADRMLDMGFIHDVRKIFGDLPRVRQTLMFSATMPPEVRRLADDFLHHPESVAAHRVSSTVEKIDQKAFMVRQSDKTALLLHLTSSPDVTRGLVFTRTKHRANRIAEQLHRAGVAAAAFHGNKSQGARERALAGFKDGAIRVLVATDIAARGIDVEGITHVVNYDLPNVPESYVHRTGRTARAGAAGVAWSFCDRDERSHLAAIERTIRMRVPVETHPFEGEGGKALEGTPPAVAPRAPGPPPGRVPTGAQRRRSSFRRRAS